MITSSLIDDGTTSTDPRFVDRTADDYRLQLGSPAVDAGSNAAVFSGSATDLAGMSRFQDDPSTPDTGIGDAPVVDLGAYEGAIPCPCDLDGSPGVTVADLLVFLQSWFVGDPAADYNGDTAVSIEDLLEFLPCFFQGSNLQPC